jgi:2-keto-4-pentenoate hydratase/2-oxohepta-3-ene-1,7-dioic acid hydratase in catechol pathway
VTRWVRFRRRDAGAGCEVPGFGVLEGTRVALYEGDFFARPQPTGATLAIDEVTLTAPCAPSKIIALWNNFHALAAKLGKAAPSHPLYLIKPGSCVAGPGEAIRRPEDYRGKIAYEGELGIVIGRTCKNVAASAAAAYIHGYTCVNDVTAVEVLQQSPDFTQWCRAKSYDTFGCIGPCICDELDYAHSNLLTRLDGAERQNYPLADMIFPPLELVSRLSHDMTLLPGDVIACGTSLGVGSIRDGSTVEIQIEGLGSLVNMLEPGAASLPSQPPRAAA